MLSLLSVLLAAPLPRICAQHHRCGAVLGLKQDPNGSSVSPHRMPRLYVLHVYGSAFSAGKHMVLGERLLDFTDKDLPAFFKAYVGQLTSEIGNLPSGWDVILKLLVRRG